MQALRERGALTGSLDHCVEPISELLIQGEFAGKTDEREAIEDAEEAAGGREALRALKRAEGSVFKESRARRCE